MISLLVRYSLPDVLKEGDEGGDTPLHLLMNNHYFGTSQTRIVEELVGKCRSTLDHPNRKGYTPFLYLQACRDAFRKIGAEEQNGGQGEKKSLTARSSNSAKDKSTDQAGLKTETTIQIAKDTDKSSVQDLRNAKKSGFSDEKVASTFNSIESFLMKFILRNFEHNHASRLLYSPTSSKWGVIGFTSCDN